MNPGLTTKIKALSTGEERYPTTFILEEGSVCQHGNEFVTAEPKVRSRDGKIVTQSAIISNVEIYSFNTGRKAFTDSAVKLNLKVDVLRGFQKIGISLVSMLVT